MPQGFTPASQEAILSKTEEFDFVYEVGKVGPGLIVISKHDHNDVRSWNGLSTNAGWTVTHEIPQESGDIYILMPITTDQLRNAETEGSE